jgi:hypothetical protein
MLPIDLVVSASELRGNRISGPGQECAGTAVSARLRGGDAPARDKICVKGSVSRPFHRRASSSAGTETSA